MKKAITFLFIVFTLISNAQSNYKFGSDYLFASPNFVEGDKQFHFVGGFLVGSAGYLMGLDIHKGDRSKAIWTGVATGTFINVMKEVSDISDTGFSTEDIAFGIVGAVVSSWLTDKLFYPKYEKKKSKTGINSIADF